jgi:hypothetical protein
MSNPTRAANYIDGVTVRDEKLIIVGQADKQLQDGTKIC